MIHSLTHCHRNYEGRSSSFLVAFGFLATGAQKGVLLASSSCDTVQTAQFIRMWEAGIPNSAIAQTLSISSGGMVSLIAADLRTKNVLLSRRGCGRRPPRDWQARLETILTPTMRTAIRILTYERRWLSQALEQLEVESRGASPAELRLYHPQAKRLLLELSEVIHALEILNAVESRERRVHRLPY